MASGRGNNGNYYTDITNCPIGLFYKCACYINDTLDKNVGDFGNNYDGFGQPIGSMSDPYYNTNNYISWYKADENKNIYTNYIDYVENLALKSKLDNLFEKEAEPLTPKRIYFDIPYVIDGYDIVGNYTMSAMGQLMQDETRTGQLNNYYLSHILNSSAYYNSDRLDFFDKSITYGLNGDGFGLTVNSAQYITKKFYFNQDGRIELGVNLQNSPVYPDLYMSNYGNIEDINGQEIWIKSLGNNSLKFLARSFANEDLIYSDFLSQISDVNQAISSINQIMSQNSYVKNVLEAYQKPIISDESPIALRRYLFYGTVNSTRSSNVLLTYGEKEYVGSLDEIAEISNEDFRGSYNGGIANGRHSTAIGDSTSRDLIYKTNLAFKEGSYKTLIARFHTSDVDETSEQETQTAISHQYGMSHGRNLLKTSPTTENGYNNPYCRVWTFHHQYHRLMDAIRPFQNGEKTMTQSELATGSTTNWKYMANQFKDGESFDNSTDGRSRLGKYTVLNQKNGLVNIAPTSESKDGENSVKVKNCMFSIENLAWKDFRDGEYGLSEEQKGPMGGRIMWFPPYDLNFNENIQVNWNSNSIIGRGEDIYTYINTSRDGTLQFKLLIDHPSIIDYYEKDEKSEGDVDDIDSSEQKLLRFFAGCDLLVATPNQVPTASGSTINNAPQLPSQPKEEVADVPNETITKDAQVIFFVFYPNNYSGVDDSPSKGNVNAMQYLANGLACQLSVDSTTNKVTDASVNLTPLMNDIGGYEIGSKGISVVTTETLRNVSTTTNNVLNGTKRGRKLNLSGITDENGNTVYDLTTQYVQPNKYNGVSEWYYRVDKAYEGQKLLSGNYVDNTSYGLNTSRGLDTVISTFKPVSEEENSNVKDTVFSFIDVYCALDNDMYNLMKARNIVNEESYQKLKNIFNTYKIKSIEGGGMASSHGYDASNNTLNQNRYNSVVKWLRTYSQFQNVESKNTSTDNTVGNVTDGAKKTTSVNDEYAKLYRSAKIIINYLKEETVTLQETNDSTDGSVTMGESGTTYETKYGKVNVPKSIMESINQQYETEEARKRAVEEMVLNNPYQFYNNRTEEFNEALKNWQQEAKGYKKVEDKQEGTLSSMRRYDNEANFFESLSTEAPFLHNMIKEKIKYFDPAFHAISPEGFNARLTFLQQCTRQGSTYSANENGMNTGNATNLAFGTPPICVLRVGDFYCSKIIIKNMDIRLEQWDLNQEGIGVQPMIADISLTFTFLGGQDLSNPIPRLQNALSFNYYKNTSVYDNRSEMAIYDDDNNGELKQFKGVKH